MPCAMEAIVPEIGNRKPEGLAVARAAHHHVELPEERQLLGVDGGLAVRRRGLQIDRFGADLSFPFLLPRLTGCSFNVPLPQQY